MMNKIDELKKRQEFLIYLNSPAGDEIYTQLVLVDKVLDKLPKDVWINPSLTWLNPACKNGIWLSEVILRLFDGLSGWEPNEEKRYNHIINNMVYGYAYTKMGLIVTRRTLYGNINIEGNVKLIDFIKEDINMNFDLIVGNPPYQTGNHSANKLYIEFMKKGINFLNKNGILLFVTPAAWTKSLSKKMKKIQLKFEKNISYINYDIDKYFDIGEKVCYFLYKKNKNFNKIKFPYIDDEILKNIYFKIVKTDDKIVSDKHSILTIKYKQALKIDKNKGNEISIKQTNEYNIPILYRLYPDQKNKQNEIYYGKSTYGKTINYGLALNNSGTYFDEKNPQKYMRKLNNYVIAGHGIGLYFNSQNELDRAFLLFSSKLYRVLVNKLKTGGFNYDVIMNLKLLDLSQEWTDDDLYKHFNLTDEEIKYVEENV